MSLIAEGTYEARRVTSHHITHTEKGSVGLNLSISIGDGESVKYTGWIVCSTPEKTKTSLSKVCEDIVNLGFKGGTFDDLVDPNGKSATDLFSQNLHNVNVVVGTETFVNDKGDDVNFSKVKWVNTKTIKAIDAGQVIEAITSANANNVLAGFLVNRKPTGEKEADTEVPF